MNAIASFNRVNYYNDLTRSSRFPFSEYNIAFNGEILRYIDEMVGDPLGRTPEWFQGNQVVRDNLYTVIATATPAITNGTAVVNKYYSALPSHINMPTDYYTFVLLMCKIDDYTTYARPTTYGALGPLLQDSFRHPTNLKPYYNEDATGLTVWRENSGTFQTATLTYIKYPTAFNMGQESDLIAAGTGVLTIGLDYIATEVSVQGGNTYQIGTQFTAAVNNNLTSGQVILASKTSPIPLPSKVHETICKRVSDVMLGVTQAYNQSQFVKSKEG